MIVRLWLGLFFVTASVVAAAAQVPLPIFRADFETSCVTDSSDWRVSPLLDKTVRGDRLQCLDTASGGEGRRALRVTINPGDAYEPDPTISTERVEIQVRRELIQFDKTTWYTFLLRVHAPWLARENRTVIQQIKQNIDKRYQVGLGEQEICAAANPLFKIEIGSNGSSPVFRAKATGTVACGDNVGKMTVCGDWPLSVDTWHRVHVAIRPSQHAGASYLQLWLDGQPCPVFRGLFGYPRYGVQRDGRSIIDTQPRFGIYRDALPDLTQTIEFDEIAFWDEKPAGHPAWAGIELDETDERNAEASKPTTGVPRLN